MKIHTIQFLVAYCVSSFAAVHCFNVWLGHKMVHAVCKQTVNYKGGEVPDGSKEAELHAGQKECEWISWTRCSSGTECKLSKKNHCGGENQGSTADNGNGNNQGSTGDQGNGTNKGSTGDQGKGDSEKQSGMVPFSLPKSQAAEIELPKKLELILNHGSITGSMTLLHATLGGFDKVESSLNYDPEKLSFTGEIAFEALKLTGNYSWDLVFYYDQKTVQFNGGGRIALKIGSLTLTGVTGQFSYVPRQGTYELSKFDSEGATSNGWDGELTGATSQGKPTNLGELQFANTKAGSHFVQELLRQIFNFAAPKKLAGRHLDLFFSAVRYDDARALDKKR